MFGFMQQYHDLLKEILANGDVMFEPRTQEYTLGISAWWSKYDLRQEFPLMTTKKISSRLPFEELLWKLRGERNVKSLFDRDVHIWDANAFDNYLKRNGLKDRFPKHSPEWKAEFERYGKRLGNEPDFALDAGDLGPVYGYQWRHFRKPLFVPAHAEGIEWRPDKWEIKEVDQLKNLLKGIEERPGSRYHILCAWNPGELSDMALGPCPFWHQFSIFGDNIDLTMVQRSCDVYLGVPFNIAQDSLLTHMVANEKGLQPRFFNHEYINVHAYLGVPPRSDFWIDKNNVEEFQRRFIREVRDLDGYMKLREWYLGNVAPESYGNERKDHIPFILEQLSKSLGELPSLNIRGNIGLLDAIEMRADDYAEMINYSPHKWDSRAEMAV